MLSSKIKEDLAQSDAVEQKIRCILTPIVKISGDQQGFLTGDALYDTLTQMLEL
jgi:uncharacterized protein YllA (UPF0747 family)